MNKRAMFLLTAAAALCLSWGATAAAADAPAAAKRFQHKLFSIAFPEDWKTRSKDKGNTVVAESPEGPYLMVFIEPLAAGKSLDAYFRGSLAAMRKDTEGFQEFETGDATLGGIPAKWAVLAQKIADKDYKTLHYWTARGRRGFGIACSAEAAQFDAAKARMQEVALTFKAK